MLKSALIAAVLLFIGAAAHAREMRLTIYDDGRSCPANCDAHVVLNPQDNGTRFAFRGSRASPQACVAGQQCSICFGEADATCMNVLYRGGGPPAGTFDFTPAFYDANCARPDIPVALRRQCAALDRAVRSNGYDARINCFATPTHAKCVAALAQGEAAQRADIPKRDRCLTIGEQRYNAEQTDPRERRTNACNYSEQRLGGSGSRRWHLLLPAACRPGTYVDRFGLDCCSANVRFAASVHPECTAFFPRP